MIYYFTKILFFLYLNNLFIISYSNNINNTNNINNINNSNTINKKDNLIFLIVLLTNLVFLLIVILGFTIKIGYKKYIDDTIVI